MSRSLSTPWQLLSSDTNDGVTAEQLYNLASWCAIDGKVRTASHGLAWLGANIWAWPRVRANGHHGLVQHGT